MRYFLYKDSQVVGPLDREELLQVPDLGPDSLVCPEDTAGGGETNWINLSQVPDLAELTGNQPVEYLPETSVAMEEFDPLGVSGQESVADARETWEAVLNFAAKGFGADPDIQHKYVADLEHKLEGLKDQLTKYENQQNDILDHLNQKEEIISKYEDQQGEIVRQLNEKAKLLEEKERLLTQLQQQIQAPPPPPPSASGPELEALKEKVIRYEEQQKQMLLQIEQKNRLIEEKALLEKLKSEMAGAAPSQSSAPALIPDLEALKDKFGTFEAQQRQILAQLEQRTSSVDLAPVASELEAVKEKLQLYEAQQQRLLEQLESKLRAPEDKEAAKPVVHPEIQALKEKLRKYDEQQRQILSQIEQKSKSAPAAAFEFEAMKEKLRLYEEQQRRLLQQIENKNRLIQEKELLERLKSQMPTAPVYPPVQPPSVVQIPQFEDLKSIFSRFEQQQKMFMDLLLQKDRLIEQRDQALARIASRFEVPSAPPPPPSVPPSQFEDIKDRLSRFEHQQKEMLQTDLLQRDLLSLLSQKDRRLVEENKDLLDQFRRQLQQMIQPLAERSQPSGESGALNDLKERVLRYEEQQQVLMQQLQSLPRAASVEIPKELTRRLEELHEALRAQVKIDQKPAVPEQSLEFARQIEELQRKAAQSELEQRLLREELSEKDRLIREERELLGRLHSELRERQARDDAEAAARINAVEPVAPAPPLREPNSAPVLLAPAAEEPVKQAPEPNVFQVSPDASTAPSGAGIVEWSPTPPAEAAISPVEEQKPQLPQPVESEFQMAQKQESPALIEGSAPQAAMPELSSPSYLKPSSESVVGRTFIPPTPSSAKAPQTPPVNQAPEGPAPLWPESPFASQSETTPPMGGFSQPSYPPGEAFNQVLPISPAPADVPSYMPSQDAGALPASPFGAPAQEYPAPSLAQEPQNVFQIQPPPNEPSASFRPPSGEEYSQFGSAPPPESGTSIPRTMVFGAPVTSEIPPVSQQAYPIPLDNPPSMAGQPGGSPVYPGELTPIGGENQSAIPLKESAAFRPPPWSMPASVQEAPRRRRRSMLLPVVVGGIFLAGILLYLLSSGDSRRLVPMVTSVAKGRRIGAQSASPATGTEPQFGGGGAGASPAGTTDQYAATPGPSAHRRPAANFDEGSSSAQPVPNGAGLAESSGRDHIADVSQEALKLVKKYKLSGKRGDIAHWLEYSFVTPGAESEWSANATSANVFYVEFKVKNSRGGADDPAARYIFEADLEKKTVVGINPNAKELLSGGAAVKSLRSRAYRAAAASGKKSKRHKKSGLVPLMPLPNEMAAPKPRKGKHTAAVETESPAFVIEGGDSTFANPAAL